MKGWLAPVCGALVLGTAACGSAPEVRYAEVGAPAAPSKMTLASEATLATADPARVAVLNHPLPVGWWEAWEDDRFPGLPTRLAGDAAAELQAKCGLAPVHLWTVTGLPDEPKLEQQREMARRFTASMGLTLTTFTFEGRGTEEGRRFVIAGVTFRGGEADAEACLKGHLTAPPAAAPSPAPSPPAEASNHSAAAG